MMFASEKIKKFFNMLNSISFNKIFLSLVYFCIFINADATTYYINSRIGDDNIPAQPKNQSGKL
jgi:hypothetical protein